MSNIQVTAGVISNSDKVLLAQRNRNKALGLKWEFPGGKSNPGETNRECLQRELQEELLIVTLAGDFIGTYSHEYESGTITIKAYSVEIVEGVPTPTEHEQIVWAPVHDLLSFDLAEADRPLARELVARSENAI